MSQQQQQNPPDQLLALPGFGDADDDDDDDDGSAPIPGPRPPWWRRRSGIIIIAIILLIALLGGSLFFLRSSRSAVTSYQSATVRQGTFVLTISATGPLQGGTYNLNFSGSGTIAEIDVAVGQKVKQGQVLAKLDKTSLQDALNQAQIAYQNAVTASADATQQASIAAAQTTLNNDLASLQSVKAQGTASIATAQLTLNTDKQSESNIKAQGENSVALALAQLQACEAPTPPPTPPPTPNCAVQQAQYNQAVTNAKVADDTAEAKVDADEQALNTTKVQAAANNTAAQNKVNSDQISLNSAIAQASASNATSQGSVATAFNTLQTAQHNLSNATLTAPHAGVVTVLNGVVGGTPGASSSASSSSSGTSSGGSTFIQIIDLSVLQVVASVNESDVGSLKVGDAVQFTVSAYPNLQFSGTVSSISLNGVTASNVVTYPVTIDVDMTALHGANLYPGMTGNVTVDVTQDTNVLLIPVNAVNFARTAASTNGTSSGTPVPMLVTTSQLSAANRAARQLLSQLQSGPTDYSHDNPIASFVLEQTGSGSSAQFVLKPVVLGLTDGVNYEVLAGLSLGDMVIIGLGVGGTRGTRTPGTGAPIRLPGGGGLGPGGG